MNDEHRNVNDRGEGEGLIRRCLLQRAASDRQRATGPLPIAGREYYHRAITTWPACISTGIGNEVLKNNGNIPDQLENEQT